MKTLERVREDLRDIRHYYSKIEDFEKISKVIGSPLALAMVESYNKKILNAPIRLYDLYVLKFMKRQSKRKALRKASLINVKLLDGKITLGLCKVN